MLQLLSRTVTFKQIEEDKMFFDPDTIVPYIPTIAAQLLNVVYERVALTGGDPEKEDTFRKEEEVVFKQWENLMFRLNTTTDKIRERGRT